MKASDEGASNTHNGRGSMKETVNNIEKTTLDLVMIIYIPLFNNNVVL